MAMPTGKRRTQHKTWTDDERKFVEEHVGILSKKEIAERLGRSFYSVRSYMYVAGLVGEWSGVRWTEEMISFLVTNYSRFTYRRLAEELGISRKSVEHKIRKLISRGTLSSKKSNQRRQSK